MCGIAGIFGDCEGADRRVVEAVNAIRHRGPDEISFHNEDSCHLGIARLSIVDVENGHQPSYNEDHSIISVFNGEIYNHKCLRIDLERRGHILRNSSDSEIIPHLYEEFGDDFVNHLNGMFAIALRDNRLQREILARDRAGEKFIWYKDSENSLKFSSEIKGLKAMSVNLDFDSNILGEYFSFGYLSAPRSPFLGVSQLAPGHLLIRDRNGIRVKKYWAIPATVPEEQDSKEIFASTKDLIVDSINLRMQSERSLGVFLSGGVDSTLVTAVMAQLSEKVKTFSIGFDEIDYDESAHARSIAKYLGTEHHELVVRPDPELIVERLIDTVDIPFADSSVLPTYLLCEFARKDVVVALSGDGGDEVFGGYRRYRANHYLSKLNKLLLPIQIDQLAKNFSKNSLLKKLLTNLTKGDPVLRFLNMHRINSTSSIKQFGFYGHVNENSDFHDDFVANTKHFASIPLLNLMQSFDLSVYLPNDLMYKIDISSMAHGLELRSPFLDYRLIEHGLSIPVSQRISFFENKKILRRITEEYVPRELINRPKKGFGIPRAKWLREDLYGLTLDTLLKQDSLVSTWFGYTSVKNLIREHKEGIDRDQIIWPMLMLELWAGKWIK